MAKITVKNTRDHDISVQFVDPKIAGVQNFTVPGARPHPTEQGKKVNGSIQVDDSALDLARSKKNPVIEHYFSEGWLIADKPNPVVPQQEEKKPAVDEKKPEEKKA